MTGDMGIGVSAPRTEDRRFITGRGRYVDDINLQSQQYAWFVRSPHPHAEVRGVDAADALKLPGVTAVLTGADMQADDVGPLPVAWGITSRDGSPAHEPVFPALATDRVRYVGNPVAVVVAETRAQARDAAEMVNVDYEELESVSSATAALEEGAPQIHEGAPGNLCYDWEWLPAAMAPDARANTDKAFKEAAHVVSLELVNNRLVPNAMEPRASLADFNPATGQLTLYTTSQNPHVNRLLLCTATLKMPEHKVRVVAPDVGGGFGSKIYHYAEELTVCWASRRLGVPVKWTAERSESFLADAQGRDHVTRVELALDAEAQFTGMRVDTVANLGGWLSAFGPAIPTVFYAPLLAGVYRTPNIYVTVKGVFTNTTPVDAYRGAGRPEACYAVERAVDEAAVQLGMDPAELRRRNFIPPDEFPYQSPVGQLYDSGDFEGCLDLAMKLNAYGEFAERRSRSEAGGKLRGRGMCFYIEACGAAPSQAAGQLGARAGLYEVATVRVHPTGSVQVLTGSHSHGQSHETTFAQIVAERLGIDFGNVEVVHGDTGEIPFGMGTYGSRSLAVGGTALYKALDKVEEKGRKIAAHLLEAEAGDIEFTEGEFRVAGTDRAVSFGDVALSAYVPHNYPLQELEPGLEETAFFDPENFTFPSGCYICEVEVDRDTGRVELCDFVAADDFGNIINPMVVEGQVHGGLAQGIGQAMMEHCVYTPEGQLLTGSYMDYCMPRADDLPPFVVATRCTPTPFNPLGVKGCGEAGAIGAPPAVINAVLDALRPLGVTHIDMPATPQAVWQAIQAAQSGD